MNSFYKVTTFIKDILQADEQCNTVIIGRTEDKDLYKKNIYPLAHIVPMSSSFDNSQVNTFTFEIGVLDQRDLSKQLEEDKFTSNDNQIDNLNTCHAIINNLIYQLRYANNDDQIELESIAEAQPLLFKDHNILDGWVLTITLIIPNTASLC